MDTSTHITIGFGLAGLAYIDPAVSSNPSLAQAIMVSTVIGSNAPDFDYAVRIIKGNGMYVEHHRGLSHSLPALIFWTVCVGSISFLSYESVPLFPILIWTFIAVLLHVGLDILNAYGTQAARPFSKKWLSLNILPLFDPFIFIIHFIGFGFWLIGLRPDTIFLTIYILISAYVLIRYIITKKNQQLIRKNISLSIKHLTLVPTSSLRKWNVVVETSFSYEIGKINGNHVQWIHHYKKHDRNCEFIQASLTDKNVKHFLANSKHTIAFNYPNQTGTEVRWIDLRFRKNNYYPYMAIVKLDEQNKILASYTGWLHHSRQIEEKLSKTTGHTIIGNGMN